MPAFMPPTVPPKPAATDETSPLAFLTTFADAADQATSAETHADLLRVDAWVRCALAAFAEVRSALRRVEEGGLALFGARWQEDRFLCRCGESEMEGALLKLAEDRLRLFIEAHGVRVDSVEAFVLQAIGPFPRSDGYPSAAIILARWNARKLTEHFRKTFGDVREASIRQLRDRVLDRCGDDRRPSTPFVLWEWIHELASDGVMRLNYEKTPANHFEDVLRYVIHLKTGAAPADIRLPSIYGFNDGQPSWPRAQLYRKQKSPAPGVASLRFTASRHAELVLEPEVLAKLQAQWDQRNLRGGNSCDER